MKNNIKANYLVEGKLNEGSFGNAADYIEYVDATLIPDLKASDLKELAAEIDQLATYIKDGFEDKNFVNHLQDNVIPDLHDAGMHSTAEDFEEGIRWYKLAIKDK